MVHKYKNLNLNVLALCNKSFVILIATLICHHECNQHDNEPPTSTAGYGDQTTVSTILPNQSPETTTIIITDSLIPNRIEPATSNEHESTTQSTNNPTTLPSSEVTIEATTTSVSNVANDIDLGPKNTTGEGGITEAPSSSSSTTPATRLPAKCVDDNYCLNGGTCVLSSTGQMLCLCPEGFYGARCQTRNICQTIIVASLTGEQICAKINRECFKNDKFFRCSCNDDEYFLFKPNQSQATSKDQQKKINTRLADARLSIYDIIMPPSTPIVDSAANGFSYDATQTVNYNFQDSLQSQSDNKQNSATTGSPGYLAECRKIDKCLGHRCRRMSEVCSEGECICNRDSGYIRDPTDGLCKLLDPCKMPTPDGSPICGQAQCVATYDHELYRCVCQIGFKALKVGARRNSTQCAPINYFTICDIPLLNKCQHICQIDRVKNHYKCSCLPGYRPGSRPGIDDHMCFFDEHLDQPDYNNKKPLEERTFNPNDGYSSTDPTARQEDFQHKQEYIFKSYIISKNPNNNHQQSTPDKIFTYDPLTSPVSVEHDPSIKIQLGHDHDKISDEKIEEIYIKREPKRGRDMNQQDPRHSSLLNGEDIDEHEPSAGLNINKLSPQERCNMYCEENKICVLEAGSSDSYRCICDRQGYVSIGDRCLDWCAAAEFSYRVRGLLDAVCLSGVCEPSNQRPWPHESSRIVGESTKLERESSWRPTFECDCTSSPLLVKDTETKLCKLGFQQVIEPCLPGNVGYKDCVENKNAYCAVLHRPYWSFLKDLQRERPGSDSGIKPIDEITGAGSNKGKFNKSKDKLYTCVCSPEKKFLVDKPRNKARCVDECELLNIECGRFNRMCRSATIAPDDFGHRNLVRIDPDGARLSFKRTGCECLPGFNVGPSELIDFTLDDNNPSNVALSGSSLNTDSYPQMATILNTDNPDETEHLRAKYMNINSRCLLDYDVVEFRASFKAPADFDPTWLQVTNLPETETTTKPAHSSLQSKPKYTGSVSSAADTIFAKVVESPTRAGDDTVKQTSEYLPVQGEEFNNASAAKPCQNDCILRIPEYMRSDVSDLHKKVVLIAQCNEAMPPMSIEAYQECIKYRYWVVQKLRQHFIDWRRVITSHLSETFDLMEGNIRIHVNKCEAKVRAVELGQQKDETSVSASESTKPAKTASEAAKERYRKRQMTIAKNLLLQLPQKSEPKTGNKASILDDEQAIIDADIDCELTLHSASDGTSPRYSRKVLLEKQLQKFIFVKPDEQIGKDYYFMAPKMLIRRESFDQLAEHRSLFNPCRSDYAYCDKQTKCEMVDTVNFTCTCDYGYTPIGSRDIYYEDSRKEVCEDINECLFDVCKDLANVSTCINEIGDYRCQCNRHYTGDNKRFCTHVCNTIPCKHGKCRLVDDHHAFCECEEGYKETDCSVQDPNVALRKANMIICGSIFTSILLLAVTFAISLNSQLKKTQKKLKRMESFHDASQLIDFPHQQQFRPRISSKVSSN